MRTPELLLSEINQAMRELRGAAWVLGDEGKLDAELLPIMRRLALAEVMGQTWTVAIGGSQSAGKTTLVRTMYGLDRKFDWLPNNQGRGETIPVLIQESKDVAAATGYVCSLRCTDPGSGQFAIVEEQVDVQTFQQACRGGVADVLLPVLRVPPRYFQHAGQAFLLLPGYEAKTSTNGIWQDLMRQALVGAAGCVIVTDSTRLANKQQTDIVKDMLSNELRTTRPIVVLAKTETVAQEGLDQLRRSAAEVFQLEGTDAWRDVICAGVNNAETSPDYTGKWMPQLEAALHDLSAGGASSTRQAQLARLEQTLGNDLTRALNLIRSRATLYFRRADGQDGAETVLKSCLRAYDDAVNDLRKRHLGVVQSVLKEQFGPARENLRQRLIDDHEGFWNKVVKTFESVSETQRKIEGDVLGSWNSSGSLLPRYTKGLGELTREVTGLQPANLELASAPVLQRLGYVDEKGATVPSLLTQEKVRTNLTALMRSRAGEVTDGQSTPDLENTARMLPAMVLEYTRIASALPELVRVNAASLEKLPEFDVNGAMRNVEQQFSDFSQVAGSLLKGIGAVLAVDVAVDGEIDTIPALLKALGLGAGSSPTAAGGAAAVGSAVASVIAVGYLVHSAMQEVRRHDGKVQALAHSMLENVHDHCLAHFTARFNELMSRMRQQLRQGLRRRYGLDQRLMEEDRLGKALADVRILQRDLLAQLAQPGQTLALFDPTPA